LISEVWIKQTFSNPTSRDDDEYISETSTLRQPRNNMRSLTLGVPAKDVIHETRTAVRSLIIKDDQICIIYVKKGTSVMIQTL